MTMVWTPTGGDPGRWVARAVGSMIRRHAESVLFPAGDKAYETSLLLEIAPGIAGYRSLHRRASHLEGDDRRSTSTALRGRGE